MFILGTILVLVGTLAVTKTETWLVWFGRIGFFDKYLGTSGGSRLGYKIIGAILIFFGALMITGMIDNFLLWALGPIFKYTQNMP